MYSNYPIRLESEFFKFRGQVTEDQKRAYEEANAEKYAMSKDLYELHKVCSHSVCPDAKPVFYKNPYIMKCKLCGETLHKSSGRKCQGHGEYPEEYVVSCDSCGIEARGFINYYSDLSHEDVEKQFDEKCEKIIQAVLSTRHKTVVDKENKND